jgi:hypothetical protein
LLPSQQADPLSGGTRSGRDPGSSHRDLYDERDEGVLVVVCDIVGRVGVGLRATAPFFKR